MRAVQNYLFPEFKPRKNHGGEAGVGRRKVSRPMSTRRPMHVVFRSSKAKGDLSFHRYSQRVRDLVKSTAKRLHIQVFELSVNSNHLHLVIRGRDRKGIQSFFRIIPGLVAMMVTNCKKGKGLASRFWDFPVFTRLLHWGSDLQRACAYVVQNQLETLGLIRYKDRQTRCKTASPPT